MTFMAMIGAVSDPIREDDRVLVGDVGSGHQ